MSCRRAATLYNVPKPTLRARMTGQQPISNYWLVAYKLTELEEEVIVQHIINLDSRGFSPRLANVEDMANYLLETRRAKRVRKL
jgi:hypothetical protein